MPSVDNDFGEVLLKYFFSTNIDFVVTIMAKNVHLCRMAAAAKNYLLSWTAIYSQISVGVHMLFFFAKSIS